MSSVGHLQKLATKFADAVEPGKPGDASRIGRMRTLRLRIATALLDLPVNAASLAFADTLPSVVASCMRSGLRSLPRSQDENELFAKCLDRLIPWQPDKAPTQGIAALLLARHAFELKFVPPIDSLSAAARQIWLHFLFETPPAFLEIGDANEFASYLRILCERVGSYLGAATRPAADVIEAFNSSVMFIQSYFNELNLIDLMRSRGVVIERILEKSGASLDQLSATRPLRKRPRIGFLCLAVGDGTETTFLAAHLEHLDRSRYEIRLYSLHDPIGSVGTRCRAKAETYVRLAANIQQAIARLRADDLDLAIFCTNLTAVNHSLTQIAAHRVARIQATTTASPVTTGLRNIDVMISGETNEAEDSQQHYTEQLVCLPGAANCYPFQYMLAGLPEPPPISRTTLGVPEQCTLFFSTANFYKIVPELSQQWINILHRVPNAFLVLMPFGPNWSHQYSSGALFARMVEQSGSGLDLRRIRVLNPVPTIAHLHKIMALADVYLDAFPFSGVCSLYDPLAVGIPIVARAGKVSRSRHGKAILEQEGLNDWVTTDAEAYERLAIAWGNDAENRQAERRRLAQRREAGFRLTDTAAYANKLMPAFDGLLNEWRHRAEALNSEEPIFLNNRITDLSRVVGGQQRTFTDQNVLETIVLPYLRDSGSRRLIDVGACLGAMTKPFLEEGWQAVLFEPDQRCHEHLTALAKMHTGRVQIENAACTVDNHGTVSFHLASVPGLSGLSKSPFAPDLATVAVPSIALAAYIADKGLSDVDFIKIDAEGNDFDILRSLDFKEITPRLIMVEFGDHFVGQNYDAVAAVLQDMRGQNYRSCVICLEALGNFERHEWETRLLTIGVDSVPRLNSDERLFGNVLFFRDNDLNFLPSLCGWLDNLQRWQ